MSLITWMLVAVGVGLAAGAALLTFGLRGRRVNDHPICRRCGFDLIGRQDLGGDAVCTECGADLKRRRAMAPGLRRRRPAAAATGGVLLAAAVVGGGALGWAAATSFDWNTVKPVWLLAREGRSVDDEARQAALRELVGRAGASKLSPAEMGMLVDRALDVQVESPQFWYPTRRSAGDGWAALTELALGRGQMSAEQVRRMAAGAGDYELAMSTRIREGDPLLMRVTIGGHYIVRDLANRWWGQIELVEMTIGGTEVDLSRNGRAGAHGMTASAGGDSYMSHRFRIGAIPIGRHSCRARFVLRVLEGDLEEVQGGRARVVVERDRNWSSELEVVGPEAEVVKRVEAPDLRQAISDSITLGQQRCERTGRGQAVIGWVEFAPSLPIAVGFDVYWRTGEDETLVGEIAADPAGGPMMVGYRRDFDREVFSGEKADIVLRPSPRAAEQAPGIEEIWGGPDIVFPEVEIKSRP